MVTESGGLLQKTGNVRCKQLDQVLDDQTQRFEHMFQYLGLFVCSYISLLE